MSTFPRNAQGWVDFYWSREHLAERLASVRHAQGRLIGRMEGLSFSSRQEAVLCALAEDALKSSEIEGAGLDAKHVRSAMAHRLGMDAGGAKAVNRSVEGVVAMVLDATQNYDSPLSAERLFGWHESLFPSGWNGTNRVRIGAWRREINGPARPPSGIISQQPQQSDALDTEMGAFLAWFNEENEGDWVVKAAIAHLRFQMICPLDGGNGRIARAIADMALARSEKCSQRFYGMSTQIRKELAAYYELMRHMQSATTDATRWVDWFVACLGRAIDAAHSTLESLLSKANVWERVADASPSERQRLVLNRILQGCGRKLTTSTWAKLANCSQDTALRDILYLVERGVLIRNVEGGRSTSYSLPEHLTFSPRQFHPDALLPKY